MATTNLIKMGKTEILDVAAVLVVFSAIGTFFMSILALESPDKAATALLAFLLVTVLSFVIAGLSNISRPLWCATSAVLLAGAFCQWAFALVKPGLFIPKECWLAVAGFCSLLVCFTVV